MQIVDRAILVANGVTCLDVVELRVSSVASAVDSQVRYNGLSAKS